MKLLLGLLGDPAKFNKYNGDFYSLLQYDNSNCTFYLLGASETDVIQGDYQKMYDKLILGNQNVTSSLLEFTQKSGLNSKIGLFPGGINQIIQGPGFIFAPYPSNSLNRFLKLKSSILTAVLSPILRHSIVKIAYFPLGGKAAKRTKASNLDISELSNLFGKFRQENKFDWYYLEAGSGENIVNSSMLAQVLESQFVELTNDEKMTARKYGIIPNSIYGGGINSLEALESILDLKQNSKFIPNCIIVGNISEDDIEITKRIIKRVSDFNSEHFQ